MINSFILISFFLFVLAKRGFGGLRAGVGSDFAQGAQL